MAKENMGSEDLLCEIDKECPINPFIRYKNIAINYICNAISNFLFSLYYWFGLCSRSRYHIKNVRGVRVVGKAYFVKKDVIIDIHLQEKS